MADKTNLYRIEEYLTTGWTVIEEKATQLTKEDAREMLDYFIREGYNPNRLRVRVDG